MFCLTAAPSNVHKSVRVLGRKNKAAVNLKTGRFDNINSAVIISSVCKAVQNCKNCNLRHGRPGAEFTLFHRPHIGNFDQKAIGLKTTLALEMTFHSFIFFLFLVGQCKVTLKIMYRKRKLL